MALHKTHQQGQRGPLKAPRRSYCPLCGQVSPGGALGLCNTVAALCGFVHPLNVECVLLSLAQVLSLGFFDVFWSESYIFPTAEEF